MVAPCTALASTLVDNINGTLSVESEPDAANVGSGGPAVTLEEAASDRDGPTVE